MRRNIKTVNLRVAEEFALVLRVLAKKNKKTIVELTKELVIPLSRLYYNEWKEFEKWVKKL
ncbi:MAG: hypothetical protein QXT38_01865 [Candidatus Aenigmatarchaeota archaeon]